MQFYTTNDMPANFLARSVAPSLIRRYSNGGGAYMYLLSEMAKEVKMGNTSHGYWTKTRSLAPYKVTSAASASATTIAFDQVNHIQPNTLLIRKGFFNASVYSASEIMRVVSVSGNNVTVIRGANATALTTSTEFYFGGSAFEQASETPLSSTFNMEYVDNVAQIIRDKWDISNTLNEINSQDLQGYSTISENKADALYKHSQSIERALMFGQRATTLQNGRPLMQMDGLLSITEKHAGDQIMEAGNTTTYDQLEEMLNPHLDFGIEGKDSTKKLMLVDSHAAVVLNQIGRKSGIFQMTEQTTQFGITFNRFKAGRGTFDVVESSLLNEMGYRGTAISLDLATIEVPKLRKTKAKDHAYRGQDAMSGDYTTELSFMQKVPNSVAVIHGLNQGVA